MTDFPCELKHIRQERHGFRAAYIRNKAIMASSGDYLIFSDGDLIWHQLFIKDFISRIEEKTAWIGSRVFLTKKASSRFLALKKPPVIFPVISYAIAKNRLNSIRLPFISQFVPKIAFSVSLRGGLLGVFKSDILAINGWNESFSGWGLEDTELIARLYHSGISLRKLKFSGITYHLWHPVLGRSEISKNEKLLRETIDKSLIRCSNGLVKDRNF